MLRTTFLISCIAAAATAVKSPRRSNVRSLQESPAIGKIVGGKAAGAGQFPFFGYDVPQNCGGALISSDMVVTAAHCDDYTVGDTFVIGGIRNDASDGDAFTIAQVIPHPLFDDETEENDIMLLRLNVEATGITPAVWNTNEDAPAAGDIVTSMGYGATSFGGSASNDLLFVDVPVVSTSDCNSETSYDGFVNGDLMLCAGEAGEC